MRVQGRALGTKEMPLTLELNSGTPTIQGLFLEVLVVVSNCFVTTARRQLVSGKLTRGVDPAHWQPPPLTGGS